jgi:alpha-beta hydrolase superfamily lysophospholipase
MHRLLAFAFSFAAFAQSQPVSPVVDLKAAAGTALKATYFAVAKPGPGVLLLHQSNRDRRSWYGEAAQLAAAGLNTVALDMRGSGESGGKRGDFRRMPEDVDRALEFLMAQLGEWENVTASAPF